MAERNVNIEAIKGDIERRLGRATPDDPARPLLESLVGQIDQFLESEKTLPPLGDAQAKLKELLDARGYLPAPLKHPEASVWHRRRARSLEEHGDDSVFSLVPETSRYIRNIAVVLTVPLGRRDGLDAKSKLATVHPGVLPGLINRRSGVNYPDTLKIIQAIQVVAILELAQKPPQD